MAELRQCLAEALTVDAFKAVVRCYGNLAFLNAAAGRLGDVLEVATEGADAADGSAPCCSSHRRSPRTGCMPSSPPVAGTRR